MCTYYHLSVYILYTTTILTISYSDLNKSKTVGNEK